MNLRLVLMVACLVSVITSLAACGYGEREEAPLSGAMTVSVDGETPEAAAQRLFAEKLDYRSAPLPDPQDFDGAAAGVPVAKSEDYEHPGDLPAGWILPNDRESAKAGMFQGMRSDRASSSRYMVPIQNHGRVVGQFDLSLDESGHWREGAVQWEPGVLADIETAGEKLRSGLGPATEVRCAVFLPSGLVFAVGRNATREAAVYLTFVTDGPGVGSFDKNLPETGTVYSTTELAVLLTQ